MKLGYHIGPIDSLAAHVIVQAVFAPKSPEDVVRQLNLNLPPAFLARLKVAMASERFTGKKNEMLELTGYPDLSHRKLIFWGLGDKETDHPGTTRGFAAAVGRKIKARHAAETLCLVLSRQGHTADYIQAAVEGYLLGSYSFSRYRTSGDTADRDISFESLIISGIKVSKQAFKQAVEVGRAIAESTNLARSLISEPASYMTPVRLASEARQVAGAAGLKCTILGRDKIRQLGMGAFLGVAQGSAQPPRFIILKYDPPGARKRIFLVGKGITFDSGGLSLKTAQSMERMKYDMSGAAAVIGTMRVIGLIRPSVAVWGVIAATENMPSGQALKPGDIVEAMSGKTIEVNNTDAEGRLTLADALTFASRNGADEMIDIATLTGACVVALGRVAAAVMGNDQKLIEKLKRCGERCGERIWQLPLYEEYRESLKSDIADLKNAGSRGEAGSISAGMFLQEFVGQTRWAHLDIAGVAWREKENAEHAQGGTGFGVRLLSEYILSHK